MLVMCVHALPECCVMTPGAARCGTACRAVHAWCVRLGLAATKLVLRRGGGRCARWHVHTPSGPRKSGMPHAVLMPAPVNATILSASCTCIGARGGTISAGAQRKLQCCCSTARK